MDSDDFIINSEVIPNTHSFIYRNKKYPIKYDFFKYSSNYFQNHQEEIQKNTDIQLIDESADVNIEFSDDTIIDFIKFVQCNKIKLTHKNVVGLNYLSIKYGISTLQKHTDEYIQKNHQDIVVELLQNHESDSLFNKAQCEEIIATHLEEYIQDERLSALKISTLYNTMTKYHQKNSNKSTNKEIIEFLFKILSKYGREASVLFDGVDFGDMRSDFVNRLLNEYSKSFDFHFINSSLLQSLYETQSELIRREEEHKKEIDKLNKKLNDEIEKVEKSQKDEISKISIETQKFKSEMMGEIKKLQDELKNQKEIIDKMNENKQDDSIIDDLNKIKIEIESMKSHKEKLKNEQEIFIEIEKFGNDFDGIVNYLKKNSNIKNEIEISYSSKHYSDDPFDIFEYNDIHKCFATDDEPNSWICFEFKNHKIIPANYIIRSYCSVTNWHLKSWVFEGSNDKNNWIELDKHTNNNTLNGKSLVNSFPISNSNYNQQPFKYLRLRQTGPNWRDKNNLFFSSIEFYGKLT